MGYNAVTGLSSSGLLLLPPKAAKSHKIVQKFELIAVRSVNRKHITHIQLPISHYIYIYEYNSQKLQTVKSKKMNIDKNSIHTTLHMEPPFWEEGEVVAS